MKILFKAWSQRATAVAFLLSVLEVFFSVYGAPFDLPPGSFAVLAGVTSAGAFYFRMVAQKEFGDGPDKQDC